MWILRVLMLTATALAVQRGFNYDNKFTDHSIKKQADYEGEFNSARNLEGQSFGSARLYTMVQGDTGQVNEAIPAAIATNTTLLLGLWASDDQFDIELQQLRNAIAQYGSRLTDLVVGISVGSEDIYRTTPTAIATGQGAGCNATTLIGYVEQVRSVIDDTALAGAAVGHVDTYTVWVNTTEDMTTLIDGLDFVGFNAFPYWETDKDNHIDNAGRYLFHDYEAVQRVAQGKPVWVTETGWPYQGPTQNQAVAASLNAESYYNAVGCSLFERNVNTWWYTLQDNQPVTLNASITPSWALVPPGIPPPTTPFFDLSCQSTK